MSKSFDGQELLFSMLKLVFFILVWFLGGIYLIPSILKKSRKFMSSETLTVFSVGLCFLMVVLANIAGFSSALGAFIMGSILAETLEADMIQRLVMPIKNLFGAIFFVSVVGDRRLNGYAAVVGGEFNFVGLFFDFPFRLK